MKKYLIVIARYKDERQDFFEQIISPCNKNYCLKHDFEYIEIKNDFNLHLIRNNPTWWKFSIVQDLIKNSTFKEGDFVTHFDADMYIVRDDFPYLTSKSFSYAIDNGNTHCMGNYCLRVDEFSKKLIDKIMDEKLYEKCKNFEHWQNFREQAALYTLFGIVPHSWQSFFEMPNYGWHSQKTDDTIYEIQQLHQNIEIKTPEWNTTLLKEESNDEISNFLQQYNIVKTRKENTIIRHWAGGQPWKIY